VTRPPPPRSRRAVCPHRALQADARPPFGLGFHRRLARVRAPDEARPFELNGAKQLAKTCPRVAPPRAAAIHPLAQDPHGLAAALWPAGGVAVHAILAVVTPPCAVQVPAHVPDPAATRFPAPGGEPRARVPPLLARRTALQMGLATASRPPATRPAQNVDTGAATGVPVTPRTHPRLVHGPLPPTRAEPWPQLLREAVGRFLIWQRGHQIIRVPEPAGLAAPAGRDPCLNPPVAGLVPIDVGQDGGTDPSDNVAKTGVECSTRSPRAQLRPGSGAGCFGAPLHVVTPDDLPTERERGGRHGTSRTEPDQDAGGQRHV
jgi:hypothetical protein